MKDYTFSQFSQFFSDAKKVKIKIILLIFLPLLFNVVNINESEAEKGKTFREIEEKKIKNEQDEFFLSIVKKLEDNVDRMNKSQQDFMKSYPGVSFKPAIKKYFPQFNNASYRIFHLLQKMSEEFEIPQDKISKTKKITVEYRKTFLIIIEKIGDNEKLGSLVKELHSKEELLQREVAALKHISTIRSKDGQEEQKTEENKYKDKTFSFLVKEMEKNVNIMRRSEQNFIDKSSKMTPEPAFFRFYPLFMKALVNNHYLLKVMSDKYELDSEIHNNIGENLQSYLEAFLNASKAVEENDSIETLKEQKRELNLKADNLYQHVNLLKNSYNAQEERVFSKEEKKSAEDAAKNTYTPKELH